MSGTFNELTVLFLVTVRFVEDKDNKEEYENAQRDGDSITNDGIVVSIVSQFGQRWSSVVVVLLTAAQDGHVLPGLRRGVKIARPLQFILEKTLLLGLVRVNGVYCFRIVKDDGANHAQHGACKKITTILAESIFGMFGYIKMYNSCKSNKKLDVFINILNSCYAK